MLYVTTTVVDNASKNSQRVQGRQQDNQRQKKRGIGRKKMKKEKAGKYRDRVVKENSKNANLSTHRRIAIC